MDMTKLTAVLLILVMILAGCTSPDNDDSDEEIYVQPTLLINAIWVESLDVSNIDEVFDISIKVESSIPGSWIGIPSVTDPNGNQVDDYSWSSGLDSGSLYFQPELIGNYTIRINFESNVAEQKYIVEGGNLSHVVEIIPPIEYPPNYCHTNCDDS